jgi:hypothetical protein
MYAKLLASVAALAIAFYAGSARAQTTSDQSAGIQKLNVQPAVLTTTPDQSATPITEVQWRRYYRGSYGYPRYGSYPYYNRYYSYRPYYRSYSYYPYSSYYPYYGSYYSYSPYYSYYRPYYYGSYPRYSYGYGGGLSIYGPRIGASFFW